MNMMSKKPYLIRAFYDWMVDSGLTPYIYVDASIEGVQVPSEYVKDGGIVLNISPSACQGLMVKNDRILFSARFGGEIIQICVPPIAVKAIYPKENTHEGQLFDELDQEEKRKGILAAQVSQQHIHHLKSVTSSTETGDDDIPPSPPSKGRPKLTVVK